jgi:hypothetical protein
MRSLAPYDRRSLPVLPRLSELADRGFPPDGADARRRWAQAVDLLLLYGPRDNVTGRWEQVLLSQESTEVWAETADEPGAGFSMYAHSPVAYWPTAYRQITPALAAELYRRLVRLGKVDFPRPNWVKDITGPGRRRIHSRLPELIAEQLTEDASRELQALAAEFPEYSGLPDLTATHSRRVSENLPALTLWQFARVTTDVTTRIVRSIADLTRVVLDALDTLQEQARRSHGWSMLTWNREDERAKDGWWPTWECPRWPAICRRGTGGRSPSTPGT